MRLIIAMMSFMLCHNLDYYAEYRYAECSYADCSYAECSYAECHYAECHYAECHYAECCGTMTECRGALLTGPLLPCVFSHFLYMIR
jgi:hypothetical protein